MMSIFESAWLVVYVGTLSGLVLFGVHRLCLVVLYLQRGGLAHLAKPCVRAAPARLPQVTVQLPVFNERFMVRRLIDAVAQLDYPAAQLEIQVLDDSNDDTTDLACAAIERWRRRGVDIKLLRRESREGFKAGALAFGLRRARGELVAIFDADFVPAPDFLQRVVSEFDDPTVGMVQARWGHLNAAASLLTRVQSIMLDGHFVVEHTARVASGRCINFNGTAGVFRRACIASAGGWAHDTLTEDLDLSYRAQLSGWRFVYRPDVVTCAELPISFGAFKSQQHRWAKGSIQTARKLLPRLLRSSLPWPVRIEAGFHLMNNLAYLLMAVLIVLLPAVAVLRPGQRAAVALLVDGPILLLATGSVALFFLVSVMALGRGWVWRALHIPLLFAIGVGMCLNNGLAVLEATLGRTSPFVRTPKGAPLDGAGVTVGKVSYQAAFTPVTLLELAAALYHAMAIWVCSARGIYAPLPWLILFCAGFCVVGGSSLAEGLTLLRRRVSAARWARVPDASGTIG